MLDRSRTWNVDDLALLIQNKAQESIGLEYKGAGALAQRPEVKLEISKDVSAFANSAGGVLVYGMDENGHVPTAVDPINPKPFSKEWLENVILANVQPRVDKLHINPVQIPYGANALRFAYVLTIPQSYTAHQAGDKRYYKRFNFQSVPMEHYEVMDTMNRSRTPIIDVSLTTRLASVVTETNIHKYDVLLDLHNFGAKAANNLKLVLRFPIDLGVISNGLRKGPQTSTASANGREYQRQKCSIQSSNIFLFPGDSASLGAMGASIGLEIDAQRLQFVRSADPAIAWTVYADDMAPRHGEQRVADMIEQQMRNA